MTVQPLPQDSGALAHRGLTLPDQRRIRTALESSTSANTRRAYDQAWRRFVAWAEGPWPRIHRPAGDAGAGRPPSWRSWPRRAGRWPPSACTKSALAKVHRSAGHPDPTDNEGVKQVLAGHCPGQRPSPHRQAKPLTAEALAAVKATAKAPQAAPGPGQAGGERPGCRAPRQGGRRFVVSAAEMGLLRRSEAAELRWADVELQEDGAALLHVRRSKTDPEAEGAVLYIGQAAAQALRAIMPEDAAVLDPATPVFGLSAGQIGRRVNAAAKAAGLGDGFTGHSGRVGMAQDLAASGVELPELMTAGRWKSSRMPAQLHRKASSRTGRGGQVLPGERGLDIRHASDCGHHQQR